MGLQAADSTTLKAGVFTPARPAPDFSLSGSDGHVLQLSQYRGKVVLLVFGYTSCPEVCPVTLATLAQTFRKLGPASAEVQVVFVSVDPERDDVRKMQQYLARFNPGFIGGTGTAAQLAAVRKPYGITITRHAMPDGYVIAHSSYVYLIDRQGQLRALMPFGQPADDYVHDLHILLGK
jgi:protein SCO1/2